jgi:uncharacterized protein Yka (UPF0111/DUF47 family)
MECISQLFDDAKNLHAEYIQNIARLIPICEDPENQDFDEILQKIIEMLFTLYLSSFSVAYFLHQFAIFVLSNT